MRLIARYARVVLIGLLYLAAAASGLLGVGVTYAWLTSAPPASRHDVLSELRRWLHARGEARKMTCRMCGSASLDGTGYCSDACAEHDAELQAIA